MWERGGLTSVGAKPGSSTRPAGLRPAFCFRGSLRPWPWQVPHPGSVWTAARGLGRAPIFPGPGRAAGGLGHRPGRNVSSPPLPPLATFRSHTVAWGSIERGSAGSRPENRQRGHFPHRGADEGAGTPRTASAGAGPCPRTAHKANQGDKRLATGLRATRPRSCAGTHAGGPCAPCVRPAPSSPQPCGVPTAWPVSPIPPPPHIAATDCGYDATYRRVSIENHRPLTDVNDLLSRPSPAATRRPRRPGHGRLLAVAEVDAWEV